MTRCPVQPRGGPPKHAPAPTAACRPLAFTLGPWQAGWAAGTQGTESLLLKPKQRCWASFPGKRGSRRLAPLLVPHLGRLSVPPTLSQGRGKGHSPEASGRQLVSGPVPEGLRACESAPRSAPPGLLGSQSQEWEERAHLVIGCTQPAPTQEQAIAL